MLDFHSISDKRLKINEKVTQILQKCPVIRVTGVRSAKMPSYKSKKCWKQQERSPANKADIRESNRPRTTSTERMRMLRQRRKVESSRVKGKLGVNFTSRAVPIISTVIPSLSTKSKVLHD